MNKIAGIGLACLLSLALPLAGCGKSVDSTAQPSPSAEAAKEDITEKEVSEVSSIYVYTLNSDRDFISRIIQEYPKQKDLNMLVLEQMMKANQSLFPFQTKLLSAKVDGNSATVDFSKEISEIDYETFLYLNELCAVTLAQGVPAEGDKGIAYITLLSEGKPIKDFSTKPYQVHLADYVEEENVNLRVITLYYPDKNGEKLHPETRLVPIKYSLSKTLINQLFAGTEDPDNRTNVVPKGTRPLDLDNSGELYTLNLSGEFITNAAPDDTTNQLALQSIVAILTDCDANQKVKFNVDGETSGIKLGGISLDQPISLHTDLIADK